MNASIRLTLFLLLTGIISLSSLAAQDRNFDIGKNLDVFNSIYRELDLYYVDSIAPEKTIKGGVDAMLGKLDPYTTYIPASEMEDFKFMTTGEYGGIGAIISQSKEQIIINEPYEGKPAALAGLRPGDILLEIDGKKLKGFTTSQASERLKGRPGTKVTVLIERPGEKTPQKITITRERIQINAVTYYGLVADRVGYISLSNFTDNCAEEVKKALSDLKNNYHITSLILDLRSNPGGIMEEAVQIVNLFVPKDRLVVYTKGKVRQWDKSYRTTAEPVDTVMPLAVLVNNGSASASEIVAGSLQDMDRAIIVGNRTYGKGLVQSTRELPYDGQLKLTIAKYYIPSGRCIQALDYSHRNPDGSVGKIPDSLTTAFRTANGRIVRDGGGVAPDLAIEADKIPSMLMYLMSGELVFDYVTQWCIGKSTIPSIEEFTISDADYDTFKAFVKGEKFEYDQQSVKQLEKLKEIAAFEGYLSDAEQEFKQLQEKLKPNLDRDLDLHKKEIVELINDEIIGRYYYQKGKAKRALEDDKELTKVIDLLQDPSEYRALLQSEK